MSSDFPVSDLDYFHWQIEVNRVFLLENDLFFASAKQLEEWLLFSGFILEDVCLAYHSFTSSWKDDWIQ